MTYFSLHSHSEFSTLDGMPTVSAMVAKAVKLGQPALGLTDHGNMSGSFQLYTECKRAGIVPFIGEEFYLVANCADTEAKRFHIGMVALTLKGYEALVALSTRSHQRDRFHRKPRIDFVDMAELCASGLTKHIAVMTGCYFGLPIQTLLTNGAPPKRSAKDAAADVLRMYASWFDHVYVEIQHHSTPQSNTNVWDDDNLALVMHDLADEVGLPTIITQDAHYCNLRQKPLHDLMKQVAYYGSASDEGEKDWTFPGDGYHLASERWVRSHYTDIIEVWDGAQGSYDELLELNKLKLPFLDKYSYHIPVVHKNPQQYITRRVRNAARVRKLWDRPEYRRQLDHELSVIGDLGMADYLVLVCDYVDWCNEQAIFIGARGSANASLVCYLLGITTEDPIQWGLDFDRFLSRDRIKPPDIDMDVEDTRREEVIAHIGSRHTIVPIGTYGTLGADEEEGRGSLFVLWIQQMRNKLGKDEFVARYGHIKGFADLRAIEPELVKRLNQLAAMAVRKSAGKHAAGLLISTRDHPLERFMPTMLIPSSESTVTQMMMDDCEDGGWVKLDVLGLRALSTIKRTIELIGRDPLDGLGWIPLNDKPTFALLRKGRTDTGVFQFEGWTSSKGCREVGVKSVDDLVVVNALYRPATMGVNSHGAYLNNRAHPEHIDYLHPIMEKHLSATYNIAVYQEQVLGILRDVGMPIENLSSLLRAIKHAKSAGSSAVTQAVFEKERQGFAKLCKRMGMSKEALDAVWAMLEGFATYGFNKAHATIYALRGYRMAYLKVHYPLEFHAALLETIAGKAKEPIYVREARRVGVRLLAPDINVSNELWTIDTRRKAVRRGLTSIKGVGWEAAQAIVECRGDKPYKTVDQVAERVTVNGRVLNGARQWQKGELGGVFKSLALAGALRSLGVELRE